MISRHPRSVAVMALLWMAAADANGLDNWYRILIGGQDAGEMHVVVTAAQGVTTTRTTDRVIIDRDGHRITMSLSAEEQEDDSRLLRASFVTRIDDDETRLDAEVDNTQVHFATQTSAGRYERVVVLNDRLLGPEAIRRETLARLQRMGDAWQYRTLAPDSSDVFLVARKLETDRQDRRGFDVRDVREDGSIEQTLRLDADGTLVQSRERSPLGEIVLERTDGPPESPSGVRLPLAGSLPINRPLPGSGRTVRALTLRLDGHDAPLLAQDFAGPGQVATPDRHNGLQLAITLPGLDAASRIPPTPAERGANALFPSEAVEIRAFADSIARRSDSEEAVLSNTIAAVHARLAFDPGFVIANGLDVLRRGRGTCVAYATLTATTLRALGYPSRVVYGYAYASGQFVGHAWTEVWSQDHWRGLDAALYADDSFDSARIALARSHGADGAGGGLDALGRTFGRFSVTLLDFEVAASEPPVGR